MWVLFILIGSIIFLLWCLSSPFYWRKRNVPYLVPLPLVGNYLPLLRKGIIPFHRSLNEKFSNERFYGIHFFTRPTLIVKDIELVQRIMITDFEHFTSHGMHLNPDDPAGANLFHTHGMQWKEMRTKINPYFTPYKVKAMLSYSDTTIKKTINVIDNNVTIGEPTEMLHLFRNVTTDTITKAIFGMESDIFENKDSVFNQIAKHVLGSNFSLKVLLSTIAPKLLNMFKLTIFGKTCNEHLTNVVNNTIEYRRANNINNMNDYLEGMMELAAQHTQPLETFFPDNTRVPRYDLNTLICQALLIYMGALDSSAITMSFFFYELAVNPEIQEKCREEINSITKEPITIADLPSLNYLNAALQETLRIYPPFNVLNRGCTKDYKIPDSDVIIEKGTFVIIPLCGIQMDPQYFPEPYVFNPDRFLKGKNIRFGAYYPFGGGPRQCLGMSLANGQMKLVTARLLQHYEFSVCSKTNIPASFGKFNFLTTPANGMWLNVRPIARK